MRFTGLPGKAWSEDLILATVDRSLRNTKTDHLDVMLLHSCNLETLQKGEAIGALVKARDAGKIILEKYGKVDRLTKTHIAASDEAVTEADRASQRFIVAG